MGYGDVGYQKLTFNKKGMHYTMGQRNLLTGADRSMTFGRHGQLESMSMTQMDGGLPGMGMSMGMGDGFMTDPFTQMLMGDILNPGFGFGGGMPGFGFGMPNMGRWGHGFNGMMMSMMGRGFGFNEPLMMSPMIMPGYEFSHRSPWSRTKLKMNKTLERSLKLDNIDKGLTLLEKHLPILGGLLKS